MLSKTIKDFLGVVILLIIIIFVGFLGYFYFSQITDDIDEASGCEKSGPDAYSVIIVDNTNKLTYIQQKDIENRIFDIVFNALPNDKIVIYSLGNMLKDNSDIEKINPIVEQCPYKDGSKASEWVANPKKMKKEKIKRFDLPIKKALEGIIKRGQDSDYSPILELIQKIKVTVLHKVITENKGIQSSGEKSVKIHLFSDLLQHTSNFSFYRKDNLTQFLKSKKFDKVYSNLEGIDIVVWQLINTEVGAKVSKIFYDIESILRKMNVRSVTRRNIEG